MITCKKCGAEIPKSQITKAFGSMGGSVSGPCKARDPKKMREAANKRWEAYRKNKLK